MIVFVSSMCQDLEDALGEVTFVDGIPEIKFSKVGSSLYCRFNSVQWCFDIFIPVFYFKRSTAPNAVLFTLLLPLFIAAYAFQVLGKIWSVAFKYHFRMPPYYTLVLRSLASLEGQLVQLKLRYRSNSIHMHIGLFLFKDTYFVGNYF